MRTNSHTMQVIDREGAINTDVDHRGHASKTKVKGVFGRVKHLIGKVVTVEEDWILKSKDWPYLWTKK